MRSLFTEVWLFLTCFFCGSFMEDFLLLSTISSMCSLVSPVYFIASLMIPLSYIFLPNLTFLFPIFNFLTWYFLINSFIYLVYYLLTYFLSFEFFEFLIDYWFYYDLLEDGSFFLAILLKLVIFIAFLE